MARIITTGIAFLVDGVSFAVGAGALYWALWRPGVVHAVVYGVIGGVIFGAAYRIRRKTSVGTWAADRLVRRGGLADADE